MWSSAEEGAAKDALLSKGVHLGTPEAWKEYISLCFSNRAEIGKQEDILRRDRCQPTEALRSLFIQYKRICGYKLTGAPTLVLFGNFGSGKSQTLLSVVRGNSLWNPDRAVYINCSGASRTGNKFVESLSETLMYPRETHPRNLALALVDAAANPSLAQKASDYLGCCGSAEELDKGTLLEFIPRLSETDPFDKIPVIALDNVKFDFQEGHKLFDQVHSSFGEFISCLFEYAYGRKVLVLLGVSNRNLAKELVTLNGTTKIIPADASLTKDKHVPHFVQESKCVEDGQIVNYVWRTGLGWTEDNMKMFLRREFRAVDDGVIGSAAESYANSGNIRSAIQQIEDEFPSVATATTTNSQLED